MTNQTIPSSARVGDFIEARGTHGQPPRRGQIVELLGRGEHQRYRVRWEGQRESILYPADGVFVVADDQGRTGGRALPSS